MQVGKCKFNKESVGATAKDYADLPVGNEAVLQVTRVIILLLGAHALARGHLFVSILNPSVEIRYRNRPFIY